MHLPLMLPCFPRLGEFLATHAAGVPSFPCMGHKMISEMTLQPEGSPTVWASIGLPIVRVQLAMFQQACSVHQLLATSGTLMKLLSCVNTLVPDENPLEPELLVARWAGVGPVIGGTSVRLLVLHQLT